MAKYELNVSVEFEDDNTDRPDPAHRGDVRKFEVQTDDAGVCHFECEACGAKHVVTITHIP